MPKGAERKSKKGSKQDWMHAVSNPVRREILRELLAIPRHPMTVSELSELIPTASVHTVKYHVLVLERDECVARAGKVVLSTSTLPAFSATVSTDASVLIATLDATRKGDEGR